MNIILMILMVLTLVHKIYGSKADFEMDIMDGNSTKFPFTELLNETQQWTNSPSPLLLVWHNPYQLNSTISSTTKSLLLLGRSGDEHHPPHEFDEMEQRDLLRTVIYLANQQINIKFKLCEIRRFRSQFRPIWNLYRCSARFTVVQAGKECDPDHSYDGYVNFIVQNPELPPLLSIRYYVFQFLYETAFAFVKKTK